jgi:hypothetical protein
VSSTSPTTVRHSASGIITRSINRASHIFHLGKPWGFFNIVVLEALRDQGHGELSFGLACLRLEVEALPDPERAAGIIL